MTWPKVFTKIRKVIKKIHGKRLSWQCSSPNLVKASLDHRERKLLNLAKCHEQEVKTTCHEEEVLIQI
jgi:hypothetical protein